MRNENEKEGARLLFLLNIYKLCLSWSEKIPFQLDRDFFVRLSLDYVLFYFRKKQTLKVCLIHQVDNLESRVPKRMALTESSKVIALESVTLNSSLEVKRGKS